MLQIFKAGDEVRHRLRENSMLVVGYKTRIPQPLVARKKPLKTQGENKEVKLVECEWYEGGITRIWEFYEDELVLAE